MKQLSSFILLVSLTFSMSYAQMAATRTEVLLETFGGTWCVFCPGSALAADDMIANDLDVSIIEYHIGDDYEIPAGATRDEYYDVSGYPTQVFDGTDQFSGGSASTSMYPTYLSHYNTAMAIHTPVVLETHAERDGLNVTVKAKVTQVADLGNNDLVMFAVVTESHIAEPWFIMSEVSFVARAMYPGTAGQPLLLNLGQPDTTEFNFTVDPGWDMEHGEVVVFIQNMTTKEVFNAAKASLATPSSANNAELVSLLTEYDETYCLDAELGATFKIANQGSSPLTQLEIQYSINGGAPLSESWSGNLLSGYSDTISLSSLAVTPQTGLNTLEIVGINPNGQADEDKSNDSLAAGWAYPMADPGLYYMVVQLDAKGSETSWKIIGPSDTAIAAGGPYPDGNATLIYESISLGDEGGCYILKVYDAAGNGMSVGGSGYYRLLDPLGDPLDQQLNGQFGDSTTFTFTIEKEADPTAIDKIAEGLIQVFPNPSEGVFRLQAPSLQGQALNWQVFGLDGRQLMQGSSREGQASLDLRAFPQGMYLLRAQSPLGQYSEKLLLK
jgi:hypothetical protein